MAERPPSKWDYVYYAMIAGTIFFFGMALVGLVGELLGWWNDVGEILVGVGTAGGALLGGATLVVGSSRFQVEGTREAVESTEQAVVANGQTLRSVDERLVGVDEQLGDVDAKLGSVDHEMSRQTELLEAIRDRL